MRKNGKQKRKAEYGKGTAAENACPTTPAQKDDGSAELAELSLEVACEKAALLRRKAERDEVQRLRSRQLDFSDVTTTENAANPLRGESARRKSERPRVLRAMIFMLFSVALGVLFFLPAISVNGGKVSAFDLLGLTSAAKNDLAAFLAPLTQNQAALVDKMQLPLFGTAVCVVVSAFTCLFTARFRSVIKTFLAALYAAAFVFLICVIVLINLAFTVSAVGYGLVILAAGDLGVLLLLVCFYTQVKIKL